MMPLEDRCASGVEGQNGLRDFQDENKRTWHGGGLVMMTTDDGKKITLAVCNFCRTTCCAAKELWVNWLNCWCLISSSRRCRRRRILFIHLKRREEWVDGHFLFYEKHFMMKSGDIEAITLKGNNPIIKQIPKSFTKESFLSLGGYTLPTGRGERSFCCRWAAVGNPSPHLSPSFPQIVFAFIKFPQEIIRRATEPRKEAVLNHVPTQLGWWIQNLDEEV